MNREQGTRQKWLIQGLHYLLDTMFVVGIIITVTLPFTVPGWQYIIRRYRTGSGKLY